MIATNKMPLTQRSMVHRPCAHVRWCTSPCRAPFSSPGSVQNAPSEKDIHARARPEQHHKDTHTRCPADAPFATPLLYRFFLLGPIAPVYLQYSMMQHMQMASTSFCSCVTPMSSRRLEMSEKRFAFRAGACPALIESAAPA